MLTQLLYTLELFQLGHICICVPPHQIVFCSQVSAACTQQLLQLHSLLLELNMYLHCLIAAPTYGLFVRLIAAGPLVWPLLFAPYRLAVAYVY